MLLLFHKMGGLVVDPLIKNKCHVCEQQLPFSDFGETTMYEIINDGVLFISPSKNLDGATQVQHANAL